MVKAGDDKDAAKDLADIAGQLASLKGEAKAWLSYSNYNTLKLRLENAHGSGRGCRCGRQEEGTAKRGAIALEGLPLVRGPGVPKPER